MLERLETEEVYECAGEPGDGASGYKRLRCSWLDREAGTLLVTFSDAERGGG